MRWGGWGAWLGAGLPVHGGAATPVVIVPHPSFLSCVPGEEFGRSSRSCEVAPRGGHGRAGASPSYPTPVVELVPREQGMLRRGILLLVKH